MKFEPKCRIFDYFQTALSLSQIWAGNLTRGQAEINQNCTEITRSVSIAAKLKIEES